MSRVRGSAERGKVRDVERVKWCMSLSSRRWRSLVSTTLMLRSLLLGEAAIGVDDSGSSVDARFVG